MMTGHAELNTVHLTWISPSPQLFCWHCFILSGPPASCLCHHPRNWPRFPLYHPPPLHLLPLPGGLGKSEGGSGDLSGAAPLTSSSQRSMWSWNNLGQGAACLCTTTISRTVQSLCTIHGTCSKLTHGQSHNALASFLGSCVGPGIEANNALALPSCKFFLLESVWISENTNLPEVESLKVQSFVAS